MWFHREKEYQRNCPDARAASRAGASDALSVPEATAAGAAHDVGPSMHAFIAIGLVAATTHASGRALLEAAGAGLLTQAKESLRSVGDVDVRDKEHPWPTALMVAAGRRRIAIVRTFAHGVCVDLQDANGKTALMFASAGLVDTVSSSSTQTEVRASTWSTPMVNGLHRAAERGHTEIARLLVEAGASLGMHSHACVTLSPRPAGCHAERMISHGDGARTEEREDAPHAAGLRSRGIGPATSQEMRRHSSRRHPSRRH